MTVAAVSAIKASGADGVARKLTDRDRKLLFFLGTYGCVTADRIKAKFWNDNPNSRAHYRRLGHLKRLGLIENVTSDSPVTLGYRLSKRGKLLARRLIGAAEFEFSRRSYGTQYQHDQLLIDVRELLERSPIVKEYKTEDELKRELLRGKKLATSWENAPKLPDAAFWLEVPGNRMRVALELELSAKRKSRYGKIFRNHLLSRDWSLVFYIAKDRTLMDWLMALLKEAKLEDAYIRVSQTVAGIYFCPLDEFLSRGLAAPFTNGEKEISLAEVAASFGL